MAGSKKVKPQKSEVCYPMPTVNELERELEVGPSLYCLIAAGKILVVLIIAYQVLQLMGRHFIQEYKERIFVDDSLRKNILPANESLVAFCNIRRC